MIDLAAAGPKDAKVHFANDLTVGEDGSVYVTDSFARVIYKVDPEFSEEARKAKFMGVVTVSLIVDAKGLPQNVTLLRGVGKRLRSMLRDDDTLARLDSDEFAIVQGGVTRPEDAVGLALLREAPLHALEGRERRAGFRERDRELVGNRYCGQRVQDVVGAGEVHGDLAELVAAHSQHGSRHVVAPRFSGNCVSFSGNRCVSP